MVEERGRLLSETHIPDDVARIMRHVARGLGLFSIILFAVLAYRGGIPGSSYYYRWEQPAQASFFVTVVVGYVLALRWEGVGGALMIVGSLGLGVLASTEYHPVQSFLAFLAFFTPGLLFVLYWQRTQALWEVAALLALMVVLVAAGGYASDRAYSYYFGPTHPESPLVAQPVDIVEWIWSGGVTESSVTVVARLDDESTNVRLAVSKDSGMENARYSGIGAASDQSDRIVRFSMEGLQADTQYYYAIESQGRLDLTRQGRFRTFPAGPASFTIAFGSCARYGSNGAVFDTIREADPLLFLGTGDIHYANISDNDPDRFRDAWNTTLTQPAQAALYQSAPIAYTWDDHDFAGNGSNGTSGARPAAQVVYRQVVPHYPLPAGSGAQPIYQAFTVGRVRFIVTDTRSARSPASQPDNADKTMLGQQQKGWFKGELLRAASERVPLIVWVNADPWIDSEGAEKDTWAGYATERRELADFIATYDIPSIAMLSGDAHMLAIDDGTNSDYSTSGGAGFPVMHAAALDRHGSTKGGPYSEGAYPGSGQFGLMTVNDDGGSVIEVLWSGRNYKNEEVVAYRFEVPPPPAVGP